MKIQPSFLQIKPMPRGVTYEEYFLSHPTARFADALILAALVNNFLDSRGAISEKAVTQILGDFTGQIFFLGTAFEGRLNGQLRTCFAYLNWRTQYPALRYLCPGDNPINHDVNCCACHIEWPSD